MAAMSGKGQIRDGSTSKSVHNILVNLCAKFGPFMTKCTIDLILLSQSHPLIPPSALTAEEMSERADDNLFKAVKSDSNHVLHALLPLPRTHEHSLRPRSHSFLLPDKDDRNLITCMLYKNVY